MPSKTPAQKCCCNCFASQAHLEEKLLRCVRCKVVFYCGRVCQKKHFPAHKLSCKTIANAYAALAREEQKLADLQAFGTIGQVRAGSEDVHHGSCGLVKQVRHDIGTMTFQLAYRSCDTPRRGGAMLEVALDHFLELLRLQSPILLADDASERPDQALLTRIVVLLVALDRDDDAFNMIDYFNRAGNDPSEILDDVEGSTPGDWIYSPSGCSRFHPIECLGYASLESHKAAFNASRLCNPTVMVCLVLIKMRVLVEYRSDRRGWGRFVRTSEGRRLTDAHFIIEKYLLRDDSFVLEIEDDVRTLLMHIRLVDPFLMNHIRDTIPLSPEVAGCLFEPEASSEFWHLLQDCFFLSPGVNDILHDFVPDLPFDLLVET